MLVEALRRLGARFHGATRCTCPFHDDAHPSAGIYRTSDGHWRFRCQAASCGVGGDLIDIERRVAGTHTDRMTGGSMVPGDAHGAHEPSRSSSHRSHSAPRVWKQIEEIAAHLKRNPQVERIEAIYRYTNPDTRALDVAVIRMRMKDGSKQISQVTPFKDGFVMAGPRGPRGTWPIYNRSRVRQADEVIVVEGENVVHALHELGFVATTGLGGAGRARWCDWSPLASKRVVYLWADNDAPDPTTGRVAGESHMRDVAQCLMELASPPAEIRQVDHKALGLPVKGDAVDFIREQRGTPEDARLAVQLVLKNALPVGAAQGLAARLVEIIEGRWRLIEWPWERVTQLARPTFPGTTTVVVGDPGAGKSLFVLEAFAHWHLQGHRTALCLLEEDLTYHLHRLLAQLDGQASLVDDRWVRAHPDEALQAFDRYRDCIESFGRTLRVAGSEAWSLDQVGDWCVERARAGCAIIGVDPVTRALTSDKRWHDDQRFIWRLDAVGQETGARFILVSHRKQSRARGASDGLSDLAGGAAYERFTQTVLSLRKFYPPKMANIMADGRVARISINRSLHLSKTRNGPGEGIEIGFHFDRAGLRMIEQGIVLAHDAPRASAAHISEESVD